MESVVKDYLGNVLNVGDKCIRPEKFGNSCELAVCEIVSMDTSRDGTTVEILTFNSFSGHPNLKTGWTFPRRLVKL